MKILFAVANDLTLLKGSSVHVLEVAENLGSLGHSVFLFAYRIPDIKDRSGVHYIALPLPRMWLFSKLWFYLASPFYLVYLSKKFHCDIIYSRIHMRFFSPALAAFLTHRPFIVEVNGFVKDELGMMGVGRLSKWFASFVERFSYAIAEKIIVVTPGLKDALVQEFKLDPESVVIVSNGVNIHTYHPIESLSAKKSLGLEIDNRYILFLGYLGRWQGIETLLAGFNLIRSSIADAKLIIVGSGPDETFLRSLISASDFRNDVKMVGQVSQSTAVQYINAADVCVAPFTRERNSKIGLSPLKLYAYMACARPIVASDIVGVGDTIQASNCGIVVEPDNPRMFASAIVQVLQDIDFAQELGANGRAAVLASHSWGQIAKILEDIMEESIGDYKLK